MPIKFRCSHCRQFLGISRSKAAAIVDCPRCGRSIRVPNLDGTVEPMPRMPVIDTQDSSLRKALTALTESPVAEVDPPAPPVPSDSDRQIERPKPGNGIQQPAPLAASAAVGTATLTHAAPISTPPVGQAASQPPASATKASDAKAPAEALKPLTAIPVTAPGAADEVVFEIAGDPVAEDVLAELVAVHADPSVDSPQPGHQTRNQRTAGGLVWLLGLMVPIAAVGGFLGAKSYLSRSASDANLAAATNEDAAGIPSRPEVNAETPDSPTPSTGSGNHSRIYGTVTYLNDQGLEEPDSGALVLLLPTERDGRMLVSSDALRSDPVGVDFAAAAASVNAIGGRAAICGADGSFDFQTPVTGDIGLFAFSRHVSQPDDVEPAEEESSLLSRWVDSPVKLRGRVRVGFRMLNIESRSAKQIEFQLDPRR